MVVPDEGRANGRPVDVRAGRSMGLDMVERDLLARRVVFTAIALFAAAFVFSTAVVMLGPWTESVKWAATVGIWLVAAVTLLLAVALWTGDAGGNTPPRDDAGVCQRRMQGPVTDANRAPAPVW